MKNKFVFPGVYDQFIDDDGISLRKETPGMTLREYYAGQALAGLLAHPNKICTPRAIAYESVSIADALIAELEGGE